MWNSVSNQNFSLWYKLSFGFWSAVSECWLQFSPVITGLLVIKAVTQKELWHSCWFSRELFYYMRLWCCGILDKWHQWPIGTFCLRLVMCDVEDSESTGNGRKFFHVLILMCDTESYWFFYCCQNCVWVLHDIRLPYTHTHTRARARTHARTHARSLSHSFTLPSEVLKPSKICTLRFWNTPLYSLDIPPPDCLLLLSEML